MTPNQLSVLGVLFAFLSGCLYLMWRSNSIFLIVAPIFFLLSGLCDVFDGIVARLHGETTVFGGLLDSLLDRYADAFVLIAIIVSNLCDVFWGSVSLVGSLMVSYVRARADATGTRMEGIGLVERAERILILVFASFAAFFLSGALNWGIMILAVLTHFTVLQRTIYFYNLVKREKS